MPETPNYKDFCREVYLQTYESTYPIELRDGVPLQPNRLLASVRKGKLLIEP